MPPKNPFCSSRTKIDKFLLEFVDFTYYFFTLNFSLFTEFNEFVDFEVISKSEKVKSTDIYYKGIIMQESPLIDKSKKFALQVIKVCNQVKNEKKESVITSQLIRSGTSIGANIREAFFGHSKADFIAKLQIALKECSESEYWIELLCDSGYCEDKTFLENCIEIKRILISSINTAKSNT